MRKLYIILLTLSFLQQSYGQQWLWLKPVNSAASAISAATVIYNNMYSALQTLEDTVIFPASTTAIPPNSSNIVRTDSDGNLVWTKHLGNTYVRYVASGAGKIFFAGEFSDTVTIESFTLIPSGQNDLFIGSVDTAGTIQWIKTLGSHCTEFAHDLAADPLGNVYFLYLSPIYCMPYNGSKGNLYITKYDPAGNESLSRILDSTIVFPHIHIGNDGSAYLSGIFTDSLRFQGSSSTWTYNSPHGGFLCKMDEDFYINWARTFEHPWDYVGPGRAVTDNDQNVYLPVYANSFPYYSNSDTFSTSGVMKLSSAGSLLDYLNPGTKRPVLKLASDNTIAMTANWMGKHRFIKTNPDLDITFTEDILLHHDWGPHYVHFGLTDNDDFLIAGFTSDSLTFANSSFMLPMLNFYENQSYYTKLGTVSGASASQLFFDNLLAVYPNPATDQVTLLFRDQQNVQRRVLITNTLGQNIYSQIIQAGISDQKIDTERLKPGVYTIEVMSEKGRFVRKLLISR
jgi:hypothetical protein